MKRSILPVLLLSIVTGCGSDAGTGVRGGDDPLAIARAFESLSDSLSFAGNDAGAEIMHHVAELVKLTGRVTPVEVSVDGTPMKFLAVAEQIDYPIVTCWAFADSGGVIGPPAGDSAWSPPDTVGAPPQCQPAENALYSVRTLIAWQPDSMQRIVRIVADTGRSRAPDDVPDVMAGLPTEVRVGTTDSIAADSGFASPIFYPGFFGDYFEAPAGWWVATQGDEANRLVSSGGACTQDTLDLDWARFACERASIEFEVAMTVAPGTFGRVGEMGGGATSAPGAGTDNPRAGDSRTVKIRPQVVDGVRLTLVGYQPQPLPGPGPLETLLPATLDVATDGDSVTLTFRVSNDTLPAVGISFNSGQDAEMEIYDSEKGLVWRSSDGRAFTQAVRNVTLRRGESLTFVERWKPASAGPRDYVAAAWLTSSNVRASGKAAFRR